MKRICALLAALLLILSAAQAETWRSIDQTIHVQAQNGPQLSLEADKWTWKTGAEHTAAVTVYNGTAEDMAAVTLTCAPLRAGGRTLGQPVFTAGGRQKLRAAEQGAAFTLDSLPAGESRTLTLSWTPVESLLSVGEAALSVQARVGEGEAAVVTAETLRLTQTVSVPDGGQLRAGPLSLRGWTALLCALCAAVLALALRRILRNRHDSAQAL